MSDDHREADDEHRVRAILDCLPNDYVVFHDLRMPGSAATVDHLVVGPRGVYAIDTMHFSHAVTFGQGADADRIWSGGQPIRLDSGGWEASDIGRLIGARVRSTTCIVAPRLPEPVFECGGRRICHPNRVITEVTRPFARRVNVAKVSERVAAVFDAEPEDRSQAALSGLPVREPLPVTRRPWFRLLVVALLLIVGFVLFRVLESIADSDGTGADDVLEVDGATASECHLFPNVAGRAPGDASFEVTLTASNGTGPAGTVT